MAISSQLNNWNEVTHYKVAAIGTVALADYNVRATRDDINIDFDPFWGWVTTFNDTAVTSRPATLTIWAITAPSNNERFAFDVDTPGLCDIPATASTAVSWGIDPNGSQVQQLPPGLQANVTLRLVGLPPSNDQFGRRLLWAVSPDAMSFDGRTVRIFFARDAYNHPNQGNVNNYTYTPNWDYYWSQTSAQYGTHRSNANMTGARTTFDQNLNQWVTEFGHDLARYPPSPVIAWGGATGIDLFAWTCRHEATHLADAQLWWGNNNRNDNDDPDGDYMPTDFELLVGYDPFNPQTFEDTFIYGAGYNDTEHWCLITQPTWTNGAANHEDWARPGKQWL